MQLMVLTMRMVRRVRACFCRSDSRAVMRASISVRVAGVAGWADPVDWGGEIGWGSIGKGRG